MELSLSPGTQEPKRQNRHITPDGLTMVMVFLRVETSQEAQALRHRYEELIRSVMIAF